MTSEYEKVTLFDESGEGTEFEVVMTFVVEEEHYAALLPVDGENGEVLLFRIESDDEETTFMPIQDKEEFEIVAESYYEFIEKR